MSDCPCGNGYEGCDCAMREIRSIEKNKEIEILKRRIEELERAEE